MTDITHERGWPLTVDKLIEMLEECDGNKRIGVDTVGFGSAKSLSVGRTTIRISDELPDTEDGQNNHDTR